MLERPDRGWGAVSYAKDQAAAAIESNAIRGRGADMLPRVTPAKTRALPTAFCDHQDEVVHEGAAISPPFTRPLLNWRRGLSASPMGLTRRLALERRPIGPKLPVIGERRLVKERANTR